MDHPGNKRDMDNISARGVITSRRESTAGSSIVGGEFYTHSGRRTQHPEQFGDAASVSQEGPSAANSEEEPGSD